MKKFIVLILVIGMGRIALAQQPLTLTIAPYNQGDTTVVVKGIPENYILVHFKVEKGKKDPTYYALIRPALRTNENIDYAKFRLFSGKSGSAMSEISGIHIKYDDHEFTIKSADVELGFSPYHGTEVKNYVTVDLDIIPHK
jgi:hypothetical protein